MKKFSDLCRLIAASILFTSAVAFAPQTAAISTYDAAASFELTLTDVTDVTGVTVTTGWSVDAFGSGDVLVSESGVASATGTASVVDPAVSLGILDGITQSSTASGTATNGFAITDILTDLNIDVANTSGQDLTFSFDFDIIALAVASGDLASAYATVDFLDTLGVVDILAIASASAMPGFGSGDASQSGIIQFTLADGGVNLISGFIDSNGTGETLVPVPAAVWLFGSGLLGLVGLARRKKA
jgi:hypothetical protein